MKIKEFLFIFQNAVRSKAHGIAEIIDYHTMTEMEFRAKLFEILENPNYAANAKKLSKQFKDQKEKPLDRAVWWIEWALRNPDGDFMKSPVLRLGFIKGNAFDVIACFVVLIFVVLLFSLWLVYNISKRIISYFSSRKYSHKKRD